MIHRDIFEDVGLFDETLPACEDYDMWLRITSRHRVLFLKEKLTTKYGGHGDQLSKKHWGLDRFRMQALQKIVASGQLHTNDRAAATLMLEEKTSIFLKGAKKRSL